MNAAPVQKPVQQEPVQKELQLRILRGLHRGAVAQLSFGKPCVIGADRGCDIVLCDDGVAAMHCAVTVDQLGVTLRTLQGSVVIGRRRVPPGEAVSVAGLQSVRCGSAMLGIGPPKADWTALNKAASSEGGTLGVMVGSLRRFNPYVLFAGLLAGMGGVFGLAYATLSQSGAGLTPSRVEAAREWLTQVAPPGSELQMQVENKQLVVAGYVASTQQHEQLTAAASDSPYRPQVKVHAVEGLISSLMRLAEIERLPCEPSYAGAGRIACTNIVANEDIATRLRVIARQVPGLAALDVYAEPPPAVTQPPPPIPTKITRKFSVIMFGDRRYLVGEHGDKYTEGDVFDGFIVAEIGVDQVVFERDGREFAFYVAAMGGH